MEKKKEFWEIFNDLVDVTVAHVMDNAITTFKNIKDIDARNKIADKFISLVFIKSENYRNEYFNNKKSNK